MTSHYHQHGRDCPECKMGPKKAHVCGMPGIAAVDGYQLDKNTLER